MWNESYETNHQYNRCTIYGDLLFDPRESAKGSRTNKSLHTLLIDEMWMILFSDNVWEIMQLLFFFLLDFLGGVVIDHVSCYWARVGMYKLMGQLRTTLPCLISENACVDS